VRDGLTQIVLQLGYEKFCASGGTWPVLGDVQRDLNRGGNGSADAAQIVQRIPVTFLKPLGITDGYPAPFEEVILTAEGIERCVGSAEDIDNLVIAVKWLARRAERTIRKDYSQHGMRFTVDQLADAVSLSLRSDENCVNRLLSILLAEGWVQAEKMHGESRGRILYARWEIRLFSSVERFSDYKKIKARAQSIFHYPSMRRQRGGKRGWRSLISNHGLTAVIAIGTVVLILLAVATLVAILL
jgi:hypothetical protein